MKLALPSRTFAALCLLSLSLISGARAQYTNGQSATLVWGQSDFTTGTAPVTQTLGTLKGPSDVAIDPTTGKYFIADTANNRVLRYSSSAAYFNGAGAETVFGQLNYTTNASDVSQTTMNGPTAIVVSSNGTLWVADTGNNRVLEFAGASSLTNDGTGGISADLVFGQAYPSGVDNFDSAVAGTTQGGMTGPKGLAIDGSGSLYVVDSGNNRILKFANPAANTTGLASGIFGQTNYNANTPNTTSSTFSNPTNATVDDSGNLWVVDTNNSRVLLYTSISSKRTDGFTSASLVLGQTDFTSGSPGTTQSTLNVPSSVTFDDLGRLYVSDTGNNRVVIFENPTSTSGANASFVLGQSDFTSGAAGLTAADTLSGPLGLIYSDQLLLVADGTNNRILGFDLTPGTPAFSVPNRVKVSTAKKKRVFSYVFQGLNASDSYQLGVSFPSTKSAQAKVTITYNGVDVTGELQSGTFVTGEIAKNTQLAFTVTVKPQGKQVKTDGGKFVISMTGYSLTNSAYSASASTTIKLKKSN